MNRDLAEISCPVCESREHRVRRESTLGDAFPEFGYQFTPAHVRSYRIVECRECGHWYCSPLPADLHVHYTGVEDAEYLRNEAQRMATSRKVLETLRRHKPGGRLLDVGCSTGDFLLAAQGDYQVEGLELSSWAAAIARRRGLEVHETTLEGMQGRELFDIVTLWGVIEHLERPAREIGHIHRLMKPGGLLCLWTGNRDSWVAHLLGWKWWYFMGQHIQYFSAATLDRLLRRCGFAKVDLRNYPYVLDMAAVANSIGRYPLASAIFAPLLRLPVLAPRRVTFSLPGEMFAVYARA